MCPKANLRKGPLILFLRLSFFLFSLSFSIFPYFSLPLSRCSFSGQAPRGNSPFDPLHKSSAVSTLVSLLVLFQGTVPIWTLKWTPGCQKNFYPGSGKNLSRRAGRKKTEGRFLSLRTELTNDEPRKSRL